MKLKIENSKLKIATRGSLLLPILIFAGVAIIIMGGIMNWAKITVVANRDLLKRERAIQLAESGIDYYRWHLAHAKTDYYDGTGGPGPYVHTVYDKDGNVAGEFSLVITPPPTGSTKVVIESTGTPAGETISRKIKVEMAIPSFAKFALLTNSNVSYGSGDEVFGPIHSNFAVNFVAGNPQPIAHNLVTSALSVSGGKFAVYTSVPTADPNPPAALPDRPDVFAGGRQFPVPAVDFNGLTSDLSTLKAQAQQAGGFYRVASGDNGYKVVLKTNGTFDLYKVKSLLPAPSGCTNTAAGWGTWSINTNGGATSFLGNYAFPTNGIMFFEDHIWVEGQINNARLTIAAGAFPVNVSTYKNIIVNNDLAYTNFDGTDVLGLIAQGNFLVGLASADNLVIDGALVAQNGATFRYSYVNCGTYTWRNRITTYGMFASNKVAYFNSGNSGYRYQPATYDANLLYGPPPSFPLTSSQYEILSWQEI